MTIEIVNGFRVEYIESFYSQAEATELFRALLAAEELSPELVSLYG